MNKKTIGLIVGAVAIAVLVIVGMAITGQPAKMMENGYMAGSPFNPSMHNTLTR